MLNLLFVVIVVISAATGCVSKKELRRQLDEARIDAKVECAAQIREKDARLRSFNQLNDDGSLR